MRIAPRVGLVAGRSGLGQLRVWRCAVLKSAPHTLGCRARTTPRTQLSTENLVSIVLFQAQQAVQALTSSRSRQAGGRCCPRHRTHPSLVEVVWVQGGHCFSRATPPAPPQQCRVHRPCSRARCFSNNIDSRLRILGTPRRKGHPTWHERHGPKHLGGSFVVCVRISVETGWAGRCPRRHLHRLLRL
jgi:hypothetical protein